MKGDGLTVRDLCNRFLTLKGRLLDNREITQRTFAAYYSACEKIVAVFGRDRLLDDLATDDFERFRSELAKGRRPVALENEIRLIRGVFKYGYDASLIERLVRFGPALQGALEIRPKPKDDVDADLVFVTKYGNRWVRSNPKGTQIDGVALQFGKLLRQLSIRASAH